MSELRQPSPEHHGSTPPLGEIVEHMCEGVAVLSGEDLRIGYANPALLELLGGSKDQILGRDLRDFVAGDDAKRIGEPLQPGECRHLDVVLSNAGGEDRLVSLTVALRPMAQGPAIVVTAFDLGDRHARMHRDRERLRTAGRRKDEFIAMLGHELRNPLAPLRHAAELLENAEREGTTADSLPAITQLIRRQVDHMARLIADLLDIGRTTSGRLRLRREPTRLADVLDTAIESTARLASRRHNQFVRTCPDGGDVVLDADPVRLTQVVTNLLSNAIKYSGDGGAITLACAVEGEWLRLEVSDDGCGIASDELEAIFEPFYQTDASLDRTAGGLGVGLALVRRIVELHGGTVVAHSDGLGRGARFVVRLPGVRHEPLPRSPTPVPIDPPPPGLRVLVVDDNEDAAVMLALLLTRRGCTVDTAVLGQQGLALMLSKPYDLAIVDIGLPDIDGYAVAQSVVATGHCPARLVALTGYGQADDRARALAAGFHEHVVKPLTPRQLDLILGQAARA